MANLKKFKKYAVIVAVIILPLFYSYFYLGAFWDPYSKLADMPVAVVNEDEGASINSQSRNLGTEVCDKLKNDPNLKWVITDQNDAQNGVEKRKYYAEIMIPKDFSKQIATADSQSKTKGIIIYQPNEKRNYLAAQVMNRVVLELKDQISQNITSEIVNQMVFEVKKAPSDLKELDDGLGKLYDGSNQINAGLIDLKNNQIVYNDGVNTLNNGLRDAKAGSSQILSGSELISNGLNQFYTKLTQSNTDVGRLLTGSAQMKAGLAQLNSGSKQITMGSASLKDASTALSSGTSQYSENMKALNEGVSKYVDGTNLTIEQSKKLADLFTAYLKANPEAMKNPDIQKITAIMLSSSQSIQKLAEGGNTIKASSQALTDASSQIATGSQKLAFGAAQLDSGVAQLSQGAGQLSGSYDQIDNGINALGDGINQAAQNAGLLSKGASDLTNGIGNLNSGLDKLYSGSSQLQDGGSKFLDGQQQLIDGSDELKNGIGTAKDGVSSSITSSNEKLNKLNGMDKYASNPVELQEDKINPVPNYGTAFAPYFISLSLWVGALLMFFSIYMDPDVRFKKGKNKRRFATHFGYIGLGVIQSVVLCFVLERGLNLQVANEGLFYAVTIMISLSFIGIMQFLIVHLDKVGQFLAILLLILQLTSCGGTFPMELVPKFFNVLNPVMPMTYSVNALKEAISGTDYNYLTFNLGVLGAVMVVFVAVSYFLTKKKEQNEEDDGKESFTVTANI